MRAVIGWGLLALALLGVGSVLCARVWRVVSVWDGGVTAADATYDGSMRLYVVCAVYDLELAYRDASGARHADHALFARVLDRPAIAAFGVAGAPHEVRYDPRAPSDAVISWEHDGRWELGAIGLLFLLGGLGTIVQIVEAVRDA